MNAAQIDRLLASVPDTTEERHRKRVFGYAATARRIDARISALRGELERALRAVDDAAPTGDGDAAADRALELVAARRRRRRRRRPGPRALRRRPRLGARSAAQSPPRPRPRSARKAASMGTRAPVTSLRGRARPAP